MPAPDYETVYDFEGEIETAVKNLFNANSITAYRQRDDDERKTPSVTVQLAVAGATGHMARLPNGDMRPDQYNGVLSVATVTDRTKNDGDHRTFRGKVRNFMADFQRRLTKTEIPYHSVYTVVEAGTAPSVDSDDNHDISVINFNVGFGIRHDAWPATA